MIFFHARNFKHTYHESASMLNYVQCNLAYMSTIGEIIRQAREQLGLTQGELAARIKHLAGNTFSRAALSQVESGATKNPTPRNLQAACDALGIDLRNALNGKLVWITPGAPRKVTFIGHGGEFLGLDPVVEDGSLDKSATALLEETLPRYFDRTEVLMEVLKLLDAYELKRDFRFNRRQKAQAILDVYEYLVNCTKKSQAQIDQILAHAGTFDEQR